MHWISKLIQINSLTCKLNCKLNKPSITWCSNSNNSKTSSSKCKSAQMASHHSFQLLKILMEFKMIFRILQMMQMLQMLKRIKVKRMMIVSKSNKMEMKRNRVIIRLNRNNRCCWSKCNSNNRYQLVKVILWKANSAISQMICLQNK